MRIPALGTSWSFGSGRIANAVLVLLCLSGSACASGGGTQTAATGAAVDIPRSTGFDGGTRVTGGFTNVVSSVRDSVVAEPRATVWAVMPDVFESLGIETPTLDPRTFVIGNPGARIARIAGNARLSNYLDCGIGILGPNADRQEVTLQLMVQLANVPSGGTLVRTTLDAYARPRDSSGQPIHCSSQRTLERQIVDLIAAELSGEADRVDPTVMLAAGRVPVAGDLLRVECLMRSTQTRRVGQGLFVGAGDGDLMLDLGSGTGGISVPVRSVGRVEVRQRGSASKTVGVIGAVLGIVGGGITGRGWYDQEAKTHYPQGVFMTAGALAGGIAGALVGRIAGSFIGTDVWLDAPRDWAGRYALSTGPVELDEAAACAGFASGD